MSYNIYFEKTDHDGVLNALATYGYCVLRNVIRPDLIDRLKGEIDLALDPERTLPPANGKFHLTFAEESHALWDLVDNSDYMNLCAALLGDRQLCLHRSAAILRTPGDPMGAWHSDHRGHRKGPPTSANDFLNLYSMPSGGWFYLNGSHPDRSGLAVIEYSHTPDWQPPEGFHMDQDRIFLYRDGEETPFNQSDIPGYVPLISEPGDLLLFAAMTIHVNLPTSERRYSCGMALRPKTDQIAVPWALPESVERLKARLPAHQQTLLEGYTGIVPDWKP